MGKLLLPALAVFLAVLLSNPVWAKCNSSPTGALEVWLRALKTAYNVFPIRIGTVQVGPSFGLGDYASVSSPICLCFENNLPRLGITVSLWEPLAFVEVVKDPFCMPSLGLELKLDGRFKVNRWSSSLSSGKGSERATFDAHYVKANPLVWIGVLTDFVCMQTGGFDVGYLTELDPLWHNDVWASVLNPEALLVANPVAQMACSADAVAANSGDFPLDVLWWCQGSWGGTYPLTKHSQATNPLNAQGAVVGHLLLKLHRQLMLPGTVGSQALCSPYPMPLWRKSQYSLYPLYPFLFPKRFSVGKSNLLWGWGMNAPFSGAENSVWMIYRKRNCCAF